MKIEGSESYFDDHNGHLDLDQRKTRSSNEPLGVSQSGYMGGDDDEFKSFPSQLSYGTRAEAN